VITKYQKGWTPFSSTPPPIYRKIGDELATQLAQASSARPGELGCFLQKQPPSGGTSWKAQVGLVSICTHFFTKYTPFAFFGDSFFCSITKLYEFCNDTCFLSVRLRDHTGHVITPFLAFGTLRNLTDCVTTPPFDFRHVTETHGLCNNASFWSPACHRTSRIVQQRVPSTSKRSNKGCMPSNNGPRTKLGYDNCPSLLTFYRR